MTYDDKTHQWTLSTGKSFYGYGDALSIPGDHDALMYGYDGHVFDTEAGLGDVELTADERREIAEHMVARWHTWATQCPDGSA